MSEDGGHGSEWNSDSDTDPDQTEVVVSVGCSCSDRNVGVSSQSELDAEQSLRDYVASEGVEVQERDVFATEMLTDDICHLQNINDIERLEEGILYEFPKEKEEGTCDTLSQTYFDNTWYVPLEREVKATDVSELRSLDKPLEKEMMKPKQVEPCKIQQNRNEDLISEKISKFPKTSRKVSPKSGNKEVEIDNETLKKVYSNKESEKHGAYLFGCRKEHKNDSIYTSDDFTNAEEYDHGIPSNALLFGSTNQEINDTIDSFDSSSDTEYNTYELPPKPLLPECAQQDLNDTIFSSDSYTDTEDSAHEFIPKAFLFGFRKRDFNETMYLSDGFADIEDNVQESSSDNNEVNSIINSNINIVPENSIFDIDASEQKGRNSIFDRPTFRVKRKSEEFNGEQELEKSRVPLSKETIKRNENNLAFNAEIVDPEASCSHTTSNYQQANITVKESNSGNKIFKSTMPTITEIPEQEDAIVNKISNDSKALTSTSLKMKRNASKKNKCALCKVRLGLCAIRCRCGNLYCAKHRYDKEHDCTFDYKAMGAEEIRRNNPKVIAEKIRKL